MACETEHPVETIALAATVQNKREEKWDWALDERHSARRNTRRKLRFSPAPRLPPPRVICPALANDWLIRRHAAIMNAR